MVEIGEKAPDFTAKALVEGEEKEISLSNFKGEKIALYFYPKDMTPGCTTQAENIRDHLDELREHNIRVIGVSIDPIDKHKKFAEKKELPFILVSDEEQNIVQDYGVWTKKIMFGKEKWGTKRTTFLIDENGIVKNIIKKPTVSEHSKEIIENFK